jgi:hypothetical protein
MAVICEINPPAALIPGKDNRCLYTGRLGESQSRSACGGEVPSQDRTPAIQPVACHFASFAENKSIVVVFSVSFLYSEGSFRFPFNYEFNCMLKIFFLIL